jgi:hypothetical protein
MKITVSKSQLGVNMKIAVSKSQWEEIGKRAGWTKVAQERPYSLLETIKMQENGLNISSMYFKELEEAKKLEKSGIIIQKNGKYFINKEHKPDFEASKKYMDQNREERLSFSYGTTPENVIKKQLLKKFPDGYPMTIRSQNIWSAIAKAVNQGIDSHLDGFTRSKFDSKTGEVLIHPEEMVTFLRRLGEGDEEAMSLRTDILSTLGIEEI